MNRILVIGCLHGRKPRIPKHVDAIIATGDFCHDKIRPYYFAALRDKKPWWHHAGGKRRALRLLRQSFARGKTILQHLNSFNVPVFVLPGNWDFAQSESWIRHAGLTWKRLIQNVSNVKDCHARARRYQHLTIIGHGITSGPEYPQHKDILAKMARRQQQQKRLRYLRQFRRISRLFPRGKPVVFLTHNVPFNTKLDKIVNPKSPRNGMHFGSVLARDIIKKHKPLICLGAHMHEHYREDRIGRTLCINAGFGSRCGVLLTIEGVRIKTRFLSKKYG